MNSSISYVTSQGGINVGLNSKSKQLKWSLILWPKAILTNIASYSHLLIASQKF